MLLDNTDALPGASGLPKRRILIVEDEFIIAMAAEEALRSVGHDVIGPVTTCEDAIRCADEARPDLVVMDIRLASQRDGMDAAIEIRNRFGIGAIFTSANQDPIAIARAQDASPLGWLPKPYSLEQLIEIVSVALETQVRVRSG